MRGGVGRNERGRGAVGSGGSVEALGAGTGEQGQVAPLLSTSKLHTTVLQA